MLSAEKGRHSQPCLPSRRGRRRVGNLFFLALFGWATFAHAAADPHADKRRALVETADSWLEAAEVSYVYGGHTVGTKADCTACQTCLSDKQPTPKQRFSKCPACQKCSLDCSHFLQTVFTQVGLPFPYVDTKTMLALTAEDLKRRYGLVVISDGAGGIGEAMPGDLLVYDGHVVMMERLRAKVAGLPERRGDIVHATGGKDVKGPGEGIQRERFVELTNFRGPLRRILRHSALTKK
jgi:hypothetical protein